MAVSLTAVDVYTHVPLSLPRHEISLGWSRGPAYEGLTEAQRVCQRTHDDYEDIS